MKKKAKRVVVSPHALGCHVCKRMEIPTDCCYIRFCKGRPVRIIGIDNKRYILDENEVRVVNSSDLGYTVRDELLIADYDKNGDIIGIELLSSKKARKPCMDGDKIPCELLTDSCDQQGWPCSRCAKEKRVNR